MAVPSTMRHAANGSPTAGQCATAGGRVGTVGHRDGHGWAHVRTAGCARGEPGRRAAVARRRKAAGPTGDAPRAGEPGGSAGAPDRGPLGGPSDRDRPHGVQNQISQLARPEPERGTQVPATGSACSRGARRPALRRSSAPVETRSRRGPGRPRPAARGARRCGAGRRSPISLRAVRAAPRSRRLDELRLAALEERIDADSRSAGTPRCRRARGARRGAPAARAPRGQLMLALYRRAARRTRSTSTAPRGAALVDELGIEPGRGLQRAPRRDPQPGPVARVDRERRRRPPTNLAGRPSPLVGRERELAELMDLLGDPRGPPGHPHRAGRHRQDAARARAGDRREHRRRRRLRRSRAARGPGARRLEHRPGAGAQRRAGRARSPARSTPPRRTGSCCWCSTTSSRLLVAAPLVAELLPAARRLTGAGHEPRSAARLPAEQEYPVPPLRVPEPAPVRPRGAVARYEAVALFVPRAHAVRPTSSSRRERTGRGRDLRAARRPAAGDRARGGAQQAACARGDAAAPRAPAGAPDRRRARPAGAPADAAPARSTGATGCSSEEDQRLFARLAVFAGGIDLEAAGAVCAVGADRAGRARRARLAGRQEPAAPAGRPTRRAALRGCWRRSASTRSSGCAHAASTTRRGAHTPRSTWSWRSRRSRTSRLGPTGALDRAARARARQRPRGARLGRGRGEPDLALRLAAAIARFWQLRGHFDEGRRWLADAIRDAPVPARAQGARVHRRRHAGAGPG